MTVHSWQAAGLCAVLGVAAIAGGCAGPPRTATTFLRSVDLQEMTDQMAASFAHADAMAQRDAGTDEPWVISIYRIANHTNQIIRDTEKWLYVERMRGLLAQSDVGRQRSIIWVYPAEQWRAIADEVDRSEPEGLRMPPTYQLTGTFGALTLTSEAGRSDTYICTYELVDLESGHVIWEDWFEVKRAISGRTWD